MYLVAIGWLYVALMMAVAEAMHPDGTTLGAIVTFLFYGLMPTALVMYVMGTPLRRKARRTEEAQEDAMARAAGAAAQHSQGERTQSPSSAPPDTRSHAPSATEPDSIAAVRKPL